MRSQASLRFLLQNALRLPLVAGGVHQRLAIDVAR
jgi:hypothetical protein